MEKRGRRARCVARRAYEGDADAVGFHHRLGSWFRPERLFGAPLAHIVPGEPSYTPEQLARFKSQGIALIPTLSLFATSVGGPALAARLVESGVNQLKGFSENGGPVLFGTDVGFTTVYDTSLEYELMHRALSESQVLASLTTNPALYFKAAKKGKVEKGFDADLVVLDGDPIADVRNLAKIAYTIRSGQVIYHRP
jgi:imidazolonepropionase-like amidohydrolase